MSNQFYALDVSSDDEKVSETPKKKDLQKSPEKNLKGVAFNSMDTYMSFSQDNGWSTVRTKKSYRTKDYEQKTNQKREISQTNVKSPMNFKSPSNVKSPNNQKSNKQMYTIISSLMVKYIENKTDECMNDIVKYVKDLLDRKIVNGNKLAEILASFHFWELLERFTDIISKNICDDGYNCMFWIIWKRYNINVSNPVPDSVFISKNRTKEDIGKTISILYDIGFNLSNTNEHQETIFDSLNAVQKQSGYYSNEEIEYIKDKFLHPTEKTANITLVNIFNKLTSGNFKKYKFYCDLLFNLYPDIYVNCVINQCLKLTSSSKRFGFWMFVKTYVDTARMSISSSDIFNKLLAKNVLEYDMETLTECECPDVLGAVIGESYCSDIQSEYMLRCFNNNKTIHYGLYCLRHSLNFDNIKVLEKIKDIYGDNTVDFRNKCIIDDCLKTKYNLKSILSTNVKHYIDQMIESISPIDSDPKVIHDVIHDIDDIVDSDVKVDTQELPSEFDILITELSKQLSKTNTNVIYISAMKRMDTNILTHFTVRLLCAGCELDMQKVDKFVSLFNDIKENIELNIETIKNNFNDEDLLDFSPKIITIVRKILV